jgi:hypothetical protein
LFENQESVTMRDLGDKYLLKVNDLLDMPRSAVWDGVRVGDLNENEAVTSFDDFRAEDWPHRISFRSWYASSSDSPAHFILHREITRQRARALGAKRFPEGRLIEMLWQSVDGKFTYQAPMVLRGREELSLRVNPREAKRLDDGERLPAMLNLMLMERYQWTVRFRAQPDKLAVSIDTDPEGAREAFRLRDIPNGTSRRAALRNWVTAHTRRRRGGADRQLVLAHLRGETRFAWNGLECELIPSAFDREKEIARKSPQ